MSSLPLCLHAEMASFFCSLAEEHRATPPLGFASFAFPWTVNVYSFIFPSQLIPSLLCLLFIPLVSAWGLCTCAHLPVALVFGSNSEYK